jgi:hypothetical protein
MRCDSATIQAFFALFFSLPRHEWMGYLSDTLSTVELARTMLRLFHPRARKCAPNPDGGLQAQNMRCCAVRHLVRLEAEEFR